MAIMKTTRSYWVDWICTFDKQPGTWDIKKKHTKMKKYIVGYLKDLPKAVPVNTKDVNATLDEKWETWDPVSLRWNPSVSSKKSQATGGPEYWIQLLKIEWDRISLNPLVYNCKAYFENKSTRYTGEQKGTMTPPQPPPPPGSMS